MNDLHADIWLFMAAQQQEEPYVRLQEYPSRAEDADSSRRAPATMRLMTSMESPAKQTYQLSSTGGVHAET